MEVSYSPVGEDGKDLGFSGSVTLRVPAIDERYDYFNQIGVQIDDDGKVNFNTQESLKKMPAILRLSYGHYKAVDLTRKSDGKKFSSLDELKYDMSCQEVLINVAMKLISGFDLSPN